MNKKIAMLGLGAMIIIISCKFLKKSELAPVENEVVSNVIPTQATAPTPSPTLANEPAQPLEQTIIPSSTRETEAKPRVTQFDTKKLDAEVREEALKMGKDPALHRKIVRIDPDGSKIYRQIGMHVIVSPNQEEVFLPDEI